MYDMMNGITGARRVPGDVRAMYPAGSADRKGDVYGMEPIALSAAPAALRRPVKTGRKMSNMYTEADLRFNPGYII